MNKSKFAIHVFFFFLGPNSNANKLGKKKISKAQDLELAKLGSNLVLPLISIMSKF